MSVEKIMDSIIIHGPGRSGTTLLYNIIALHPDLGWISGYVNKFPEFPILSIFNCLQDFEVVEKFSRGKHKWPRPAEAYDFWKYFFPSFSTSEHVTSTPKLKNKPELCIKTITDIIRYQGKKDS